jgi:formylglycine-generating enzyme required for sulfatase activity
MHGGFWEICMDAWHPGYTGAPDDGRAWLEVEGRDIVIRGGSIRESVAFARSAVRWRHPRGVSADGVGFRLVSPLPER